MKNMDDVDLKVRMKGKGAGKFRVKYMVSGVKPMILEHLLENMK